MIYIIKGFTNSIHSVAAVFIINAALQARIFQTNKISKKDAQVYIFFQVQMNVLIGEKRI